MNKPKEILSNSPYNALQLYGLLQLLTTSGTKQTHSLNGFSILPNYTYAPQGGVVEKMPYFLQKGSTLITAPAHDTEPHIVATTAAPLKDILQNLNKIKDWTHAIIPIAQSNKYLFGLLTRRHFTYLELKKDNIDKVTAHHNDSKGWLSKFYSLEPIKKELSNAFGPKNFTFKASYLGQQDITDHTNCGRFVLAYIVNLLSPQKEALSKSSLESSFKTFDKLVDKATTELIKKDTSSVNKERDNLTKMNKGKRNTEPGPHLNKLKTTRARKPRNAKSSSYVDKVQTERSEAAAGTKKVAQSKVLIPNH